MLATVSLGRKENMIFFVIFTFCIRIMQLRFTNDVLNGGKVE